MSYTGKLKSPEKRRWPNLTREQLLRNGSVSFQEFTAEMNYRALHGLPTEGPWDVWVNRRFLGTWDNK